jgi:integrase
MAKEKKRRPQWKPDESMVMDPSEIRRLRDVMQARAAQDLAKGRRTNIVRWSVVDLALSAGLRVSELAALKVADLRLTGSKPQLTVKSGKGGKKRTIPLSGPLSGLKQHLAEFLDWKEHAKEPTGPGAPLFGSRYMGKWRHYSTFGLKNQFKKALALAGIPPERYSIHCARHTAITYLYARTKNLRLVQDIAGHSTPGMTAHYAAIVNGWASLNEAGEKPLYD